MTPEDFKNWRKENGFRSQRAAADALGVSPGSVLNYETGHRREDPTRLVVIPRNIALACAAISAELEPVGEQTNNDEWERSPFYFEDMGAAGVGLSVKRSHLISCCVSETEVDANFKAFKEQLDKIAPHLKKEVRKNRKRPLIG